MNKFLILCLLVALSTSKRIKIDYCHNVDINGIQQVQVGDQLIVQFYETTSTGYSWSYYQPTQSNGATILKEIYTSSIPPNSILYGVASIRVIAF